MMRANLVLVGALALALTGAPSAHAVQPDEIMADPAIVKSWADTGVAPYPKDQRSPAAARALLKSEIARWGQVVRDNNIQAQMQ